MSLSALAPYIFTDSSADGRKKTIEWLQTRHLLANQMTCNRCHFSMNLVKRERSGSQNDKWAWRCSACSSIKSIRSGSWFEGQLKGFCVAIGDCDEKVMIAVSRHARVMNPCNHGPPCKLMCMPLK